MISGFTGSTIISGNGIIAANNDTVYVPYLNLNSIPNINSAPTEILVRNSVTGNVEYIDPSSLSGGGGIGIDPYYDLGSQDFLITWDVSGNSINYEVTLTGNTHLDLINVRNGDYGTLIVNQDGVGGRTITFNLVNGGVMTHLVVNGGGGTPTLTSTPNAIDILSFTHNGSKMFWTVGNDYT